MLLGQVAFCAELLFKATRSRDQQALPQHAKTVWVEFFSHSHLLLLTLNEGLQVRHALIPIKIDY